MVRGRVLYMKGLLLDVDYETRDGKAVVRLFFKGEEKNFIAVDSSFSPYFYVAPTTENLGGLMEEIRRVEKVREVLIEEKRRFGAEMRVLRVILHHPQDVPTVREVIKALPGVEMTYEYDILFVRRYLIDKGLTPLTWMEVKGRENGEVQVEEISPSAGELKLKVLAFDTEVYNPKGAPREDRDPIIMISLASNTGLRKVLTWRRPEKSYDYLEVLENEKAILRRFGEIVNEGDYDILVGYNTDNFDFPYIKERLKRLKLELPLGRDGSEATVSKRRALPEAKVKGRPHLDLYPIVRRSVKLTSYVLENVIREVLEIEKEKIPGEKLWQYWDKKEKLGKLVEYSMEDAEVTLQLSEKFLPLHYELTRLVGQPLHDVSRMTAGQLVEWLLMREASRGREVIPNRAGGEEFVRRREETYIGGYVKEPKKGLSEDIAVFDFRSLYPSVIVTHNIDPSTFNRGGRGDKVPDFDYWFSKEVKGFIPAILEGLIDRRAEIKGKMKEEEDPVRKRMLDVEQRALKILANSFYGYMGYPRARWYKKECAESVTSFARMYIQKVMAIAEKEFGLEVVYGDTDSLFVVVPEGKKEKAHKFLNRVNETLPGIIELEYEGFYRRGIFVTKKRYALIDEEDRIAVKGLEFVRRDWAPIAKKTQREVLEAILKDGSPEKAAEMVRKTIEDIRERRVSLEDVTLYTELTKSIPSYKSIGPHVVAAKKLQAKGREVRAGTIIGYAIVKGTKMISERAEPIEDVSLEDYDAEYYIENQILPTVSRIMQVLGYSKSYLKEGVEQVSLEKFF
jgi:DNA polymerase I